MFNYHLILMTETKLEDLLKSQHLILTQSINLMVLTSMAVS